MARIDNLGDKANTNGFDKNPQNINKNGAPLSFRSTFKDMIASEAAVIWVDEDQVETRVNEKSKKLQYGISFQGADAIVASVLSIATGKVNDRVKLDALKFLWEQIDGKAKQSVELEGGMTRNIGFGGEEMVENTEGT